LMVAKGPSETVGLLLPGMNVGLPVYW
jgi:hypothetical protein